LKANGGHSHESEVKFFLEPCSVINDLYQPLIKKCPEIRGFPEALVVFISAFRIDCIYYISDITRKSNVRFISFN